jgi:hypothetical protein
MIVVLLTTTILTNFIVMFKNREYSMMMMEGFTSEEVAKLKAIMDDAQKAMDVAKRDMDAVSDDKKKTELKLIYDAAKKKYDEAKEKYDLAVAPATSTSSSEPATMGAQPANTVQQPFTNSKSATRDGMSQLSPAPVNGESVNPMMPAMGSGQNAQKEQAYNILSNMGGQGGDMVAQQTEMINNLKSIEPILNTAQNFLDKFENSSISKMFSGSGGFPGMSLLTGSGGNKTSPAPVGS